MRKLVLATVSILALTSAAWADAITATARVDGSIVAVESSADGNLNVNSQAFGPVFNLNSLSLNSESFLSAPDLLKTNTLDVAQTAVGNHQLIIDVVASGLAGPNSLQSILSSFSVTGMTSGWSAQEQTFINGLLLADTGVFTQTADSAFSTNPAFLTNPFTAEVKYTINSFGIGSFNGGIDISAVPGPVVGAGLPGLLGALGLGGWSWKRRRKAAA